MAKFLFNVAGIALLLSGCSQPDGKETERAEVTHQDAAPAGKDSSSPVAKPAAEAVRLVRLPDSREGDGSAMPGIVDQSGGCVTIRTADGKTVLLASTNPDIMWDGTAQGLRTGTFVVRIGERIEVGGSMATRGAKLDWKSAPDASCPQDAIWIMASLKPG
jgi:hypothetical protein